MSDDGSPLAAPPGATFRLPDGRQVRLFEGALIGRLPQAALSLDHPGISEVHAYLSLRGTVLKMLALRGLFAVDGVPMDEVVLRQGLSVHLAQDYAVDVTQVHLPRALLAVEGPVPRQILSGTTSIVGEPLRLISGFVGDAAAHIWLRDGRWRARVAGQPAFDLVEGASFEALGQRFRAVTVDLQASELGTVAEARVDAPLVIEATYDSVRISSGGAPVVLTGKSARMLTELLAFGEPVPWEVLGRELWRDEPQPHVLRHRFDVTLARLRRQLRRARVRTDLVRMDGHGHIGLVLYPHDRKVGDP